MTITLIGQFCAEALRELVSRHDIHQFDRYVHAETNLRDTEILVVRGHVRVDTSLLAGAPALQAIIKAGSGVDTIDLNEANRRAVKVFNTPASSSAVAELTFALMLSLQRHLNIAVTALREGNWNAKYQCVGQELRGSTLGIVGFGQIGQRVAEIAHGFGMGIATCDRRPEVAAKQACARINSVRFGDLAEVLKSSEIVSLHLPLSPETHDLIGRREFSMMRPGALLINTARAQLVNRSALEEALYGGIIRGAAFDVFHEEPPRPDDKIIGAPNVVCTPHIGAQTQQAHRAIGRSIVQIVSDIART